MMAVGEHINFNSSRFPKIQSKYRQQTISPLIFLYYKLDKFEQPANNIDKQCSALSTIIISNSCEMSAKNLNINTFFQLEDHGMDL